MNDPQKEAREIAERHGIKAYEPPAETTQEPCECPRKALPAIAPESLRELERLRADAETLCPICHREHCPDGHRAKLTKRYMEVRYLNFLRGAAPALIAAARELETKREVEAERDRLKAECEQLRGGITALANDFRDPSGTIGLGEILNPLAFIEALLSVLRTAQEERARLRTECEQLRAGNTKAAAALDKFADYCRERNELVSELAAARSLLEEAREVLQSFVHWSQLLPKLAGSQWASVTRVPYEGQMSQICHWLDETSKEANSVLAKIEASRTPEVKL